jgi:hypothetical protein
VETPNHHFWPEPPLCGEKVEKTHISHIAPLGRLDPVRISAKDLFGKANAIGLCYVSASGQSPEHGIGAGSPWLTKEAWAEGSPIERVVRSTPSVLATCYASASGQSDWLQYPKSKEALKQAA